MHSVHFAENQFFMQIGFHCVCPGGIQDCGHREGGQKPGKTKSFLLHPDIGTTQTGGSHVGIGGTPMGIPKGGQMGATVASYKRYPRHISCAYVVW